MSDSAKQIHDWQEKIKNQYGSEKELYQYLFQTLDNFYYRYIETAESKNLITQDLGNQTWGNYGFEASMVDALKIKNAEAKNGIKELAKSIPKSQKPMVRYGLFCNVKNLKPNQGELEILSEIHWDFPHYQDHSKKVLKKVIFKYQELSEFRKQLALKLEEACELFS
ncbi:MAG: hypothetical protein AB7I27_10520 [Bacteriovoracaceae bacterium]